MKSNKTNHRQMFPRGEGKGQIKAINQSAASLVDVRNVSGKKGQECQGVKKIGAERALA